MKWSKRWAVGTVTLLMGLAGCASQPSRIRCDDRLEPINAPAPKVASVPALKLGTAPVSKGEAR